ncbi:PLC-like phosphodiesterase TIM beta/alpha-barrel domain superfamily [Arabidopsis suecica]|uniref:PLC-like phosphodiesterase TIM beta/alpha-barrel domain superfamily n=1 Tax=Arabidopsis suecica TaxID=45249 RepID=A0A8T2E490_ARASU|nr:PLC-like phosphodiesterase TIM beta/alpha-barrel domain superfamily [Arabidopsis suecica]
MSACINGLCRAVTVSLLLLLLSFSFSSACSNGNCQLLDSCSSATDCVSGLYCGDCPAVGRSKPVCTRGQATIPTSIINGLPFNKYTWLMTHNAFSNANAPLLPGVERITFYNQEDTITNQLQNGVRGLMLDMYDFNNDIWLCHSLRGQCFNFTAFQPAINILREVEAFLSQNPTEIVTIIIEDYVHRPKGLSTLFANAGLDKYWFPVSKMPRKGEDWPTVTDMVQENHRLLVFTSVAAKEDEEGVAYQWRYMVENESGDPGVKRGSCPNRKESQPLNSKSSSLFLMNYFPTYPVEKDACKEHSAPLAEMVGTCLKSGGNRMPNFLAVNFYMRSDGGGVFEILDRMNGPVLCGCETLSACQPGAAYGSCKNVTVQTRTPSMDSTAGSNSGGSYSGSVQFSRSLASVAQLNNIVVFCFSLLPLLIFLL